MITKKQMIKTIDDEFKKAWEEMLKEKAWAKDAIERGWYKDKYDCLSFTMAQSKALALWDIIEKLELKK